MQAIFVTRIPPLLKSFVTALFPSVPPHYSESILTQGSYVSPLFPGSSKLEPAPEFQVLPPESLWNRFKFYHGERVGESEYFLERFWPRGTETISGCKELMTHSLRALFLQRAW